MTDAFILGGVRSPVGRYGGALSHRLREPRFGVLGVWVGSGQGVALALENADAGK